MLRRKFGLSGSLSRTCNQKDDLDEAKHRRQEPAGAANGIGKKHSAIHWVAIGSYSRFNLVDLQHPQPISISPRATPSSTTRTFRPAHYSLRLFRR